MPLTTPGPMQMLKKSDPIEPARREILVSLKGTGVHRGGRWLVRNVEFDIAPRLLGPVVNRALRFGLRHALRKIGRTA